MTQDQLCKKFKSKIVIIFLSISLNMCLPDQKNRLDAAQKNHLIKTVLLSTHNICFG